MTDQGPTSLHRSVLAELQAVMGPQAVLLDPSITSSYRHDRASWCPAGHPLAVVRARSTSDVQRVLRVASSNGIAVVPQGARSGLAGAANAADDCIVLSLERMNRIVQIDASDRLAVVQPGVITADLARAVADQGLHYPPDPSSWELSTIGGNVATNAGGLCCVKYGVTGDHVLGLEVVLASGEAIRTGGRTVKGVAGYDLTSLLVGSEGTLGVITEVTLALRPRAGPPRTLAATFPSTAAAIEAVVAITQQGVVPSLLEFLDRTTLRAINSVRDLGLPAETSAMLIAQADSVGDSGSKEIQEIARLCRVHGSTAVLMAESESEVEVLLGARRAALPALEAMGVTVLDDVCVPRTRLADLIGAVERIAASWGLTIAVMGHAGDGNMHPTIVYPAGDESAGSRAVGAFEEILATALALGGTITGEHGIGLLKRSWLGRELGPVALALHEAIKRAFDPRGILNPGKGWLQPTSGSMPLGTGFPPVPASAEFTPA